MTAEATTIPVATATAGQNRMQITRPKGGLPLVALSGATGKTSTGWLLIQILENAGGEVGAWLTDGVYVDGALRQDELHAWELAANATRAREIDVLVQEIPSVLATSLPRNSAWMAVLTSICGSDDQCQRDDAAARNQAGVLAVLGTLRDDGRIVANADDLMIVDAAANVAQPTTYFAMNGANPVLRNHVVAGCDAVWVQNGWIKAQACGAKKRLVSVENLPATLNGHVIFQIQNALAAIAAALAIGVPTDNIAAALAGPGGNATKSVRSGLSISTRDRRTIVADTPGTLMSIKQLVRGVRAFGPRRVIHVLGNLQRLSSSETEEAGRVLGSLGGIAILLDDGSSAGRTAQIRDGLMSSDNPPVVVTRDAEETNGEYIHALLEEGDVALVLDHPI